MKITLEDVKTGAILAAVGVTLYAAYRLYKLGMTATGAVSGAVSGALNAVGDFAGSVADKVSDVVSGAPGSANVPRGSGASVGANQGPPPPPYTAPIMENIPGFPDYVGAMIEDSESRGYAFAQDYSPSALDESFRG